MARVGEWQLARDLLSVLKRLEDPAWPAWGRSKRLGLQATIHLAQGQPEAALALYREQRAMLLGVGERSNLIKTEAGQCASLNMMGRFDECISLAQAVIEHEGSVPFGSLSRRLMLLMLAQAFCGRISEAQHTLVVAMPGWRRNASVIVASGAMAVVLAELGRWADAARVGAAALAFQRRGHIPEPQAWRSNQRWQALLAAANCKAEDLERWQREGETLDEAAIEAICLGEIDRRN